MPWTTRVVERSPWFHELPPLARFALLTLGGVSEPVGLPVCHQVSPRSLADHCQIDVGLVEQAFTRAQLAGALYYEPELNLTALHPLWVGVDWFVAAKDRTLRSWLNSAAQLPDTPFRQAAVCMVRRGLLSRHLVVRPLGAKAIEIWNGLVKQTFPRFFIDLRDVSSFEDKLKDLGDLQRFNDFGDLRDVPKNLQSIHRLANLDAARPLSGTSVLFRGHPSSFEDKPSSFEDNVPFRGQAVSNDSATLHTLAIRPRASLGNHSVPAQLELPIYSQPLTFSPPAGVLTAGTHPANLSMSVRSVSLTKTEEAVKPEAKPGAVVAFGTWAADAVQRLAPEGEALGLPAGGLERCVADLERKRSGMRMRRSSWDQSLRGFMRQAAKLAAQELAPAAPSSSPARSSRAPRRSRSSSPSAYAGVFDEAAARSAAKHGLGEAELDWLRAHPADLDQAALVHFRARPDTIPVEVVDWMRAHPEGLPEEITRYITENPGRTHGTETPETGDSAGSAGRGPVGPRPSDSGRGGHPRVSRSG